uniref:Uncharacterized protein n=1 Tax=Anguilla anguilla TaxID=7936 RepID=A0A0E9RLN8_ANGAN
MDTCQTEWERLYWFSTNACLFNVGNESITYKSVPLMQE